MKISRKILLVLPLMVAGYLAVAAMWTWLAFPSAARALPPSLARGIYLGDAQFGGA